MARPRPATPSRRPWMVAVLAVVALLVAACGSGGDEPGDQLAAAVRDTFDGSFAYELTADAALPAVGGGAGELAALLGGFSASGVEDGDDRSFRLDVGGSTLVQGRALGQEALYLQLGLDQLSTLLGGGALPRDELLAALEALGLGGEVEALVVALLEGRWIGIEGGFDADRIADVLGGGAPDEEPSQPRAGELFGGDVPAFLERFVTVVERETAGQQQRFTVALQLRELLRTAAELHAGLAADGGAAADLEADLADVPETVPGTVVVEDGLVHRVVFDLAAAAGEAAEGAAEIRLEVTDHDAVAPVTAPEGATVISSERLVEALARIASVATGAVPALEG